MQMSVNVREVRAVTVLDLSGDFVSPEGYELLRDRVKQLLADDQKQILVNLANVKFMDSGGLGTLLESLISTRKQGGELKLASLNERVQRLLEITRLKAAFDIYANEQEAIASFKEPPRVDLPAVGA